MTRIADRVYRDRTAIERLESLIAVLPNGAWVALRLEDGSELRGIVAARPTLQVFFNATGEEGSNAVLRIEPLDPAQFDVPRLPRDVWLDQVIEVRDLGPP